MGILIQEMTIEDYQDVRNLWEQTEGIETADTDSREGLSRFLERNPGLSFVARDGENIVGVVLCAVASGSTFFSDRFELASANGTCLSSRTMKRR